MMSYHEILRFRLQENEEIVVEAGAVWLTFSGRDFVLQQGQRFRAGVGGEAMLQGLSESGSQFRRVQAATPRKAGLSSLRSRVSEWLSVQHHSTGNKTPKGAL